MNDDLISRQEVLNKLNKLDQQELYLPCHFKEYVVDEVPNISQRIGQWLYTNTTRWDAKDKDGEQKIEIRIVAAKCSVCERWAEKVNNHSPYMTYNICPNCGADMRSKAREYLEYGELITKGIAQGIAQELRGDSDE